MGVGVYGVDFPQHQSWTGPCETKRTVTPNTRLSAGHVAPNTLRRRGLGPCYVRRTHTSHDGYWCTGRVHGTDRRGLLGWTEVRETTPGILLLRRRTPARLSPLGTQRIRSPCHRVTTVNGDGREELPGSGVVLVMSKDMVCHRVYKTRCEVLRSGVMVL